VSANIPSAIGPVARHRPADGWRITRICLAAACGATLAEGGLILNFWPLGAGGSGPLPVRFLVEMALLLAWLPLAGFAVGLLVAAGLAAWRRQFRRLASSLFAIAAIPLRFLAVARLPVCDPWLWYAIANHARFEALASDASPPNAQPYTVVATRDVSIGFAGINPNHFVVLIYDASDAVGLDPSDRPTLWQHANPIPKGRRLYGHVFRVDEFD
jgi:hypothetical protein